jgi:hypothetical protein
MNPSLRGRTPHDRDHSSTAGAASAQSNDNDVDRRVGSAILPQARNPGES